MIYERLVWEEDDLVLEAEPEERKSMLRLVWDAGDVVIKGEESQHPLAWNEDDIQKWDEELHPRAADGKFSSGDGENTRTGEGESHVHPAIVGFEARHAGADFEHGQGIDANGGVIWPTASGKEGEKGSINFSPEERDRLSGAQFTHNHPNGSSLSMPDLTFAANCNMSEIRAVGRDFVYSMKPGSDGWPHPQEIREVFARETERLLTQYPKWEDFKVSTPHDADLAYSHELMRRMAAALPEGMTYERHSRA